MKTAPPPGVAQLDAQSVRWFIRYMKAVKQRANETGYISDSAAYGRVIDDLTWNVQRGNPSGLVKVEGE